MTPPAVLEIIACHVHPVQEIFWMAQHTRHQQNIIRNYYRNREDIALQRLQELVTELYLAEGKKRDQVWKSIAGHLEKVGVKKETIDHLVAQNKPEAVLGVVESMLKK